MEFRYEIQVLFPFVTVSSFPPDDISLLISVQEESYRYIEYKVMSLFKAYKKRDRGDFVEFLIEGKKLIQVNKDFCSIKQI